jgi:hypothetical protein
MDARGKHVMGFDQQKTAHHFRLYEDGGAIEVSVKDTADAEELNAIRAHLPHIATMFADGEFDAPMLVHDTKNVAGAADSRAPEGAAPIQLCGDAGRRTRGHRTTDKDALNALHAFLRFQITDHQTGDPVSPTRRGR